MHRLYYSINYEDYDVGNSAWSCTHTARAYSTVLRHDLKPCLIHDDRKVFLSEDSLRDYQTEFGFDDDQVSDIPYRNGPRRQTESNSASDNTKQTPITHFFDKQPSIPVSRKRSRSAGGASQTSSALMTTSDDVDSDDDYVTEQEMDGHDEQDSD
jgi:hypothetical protein